ncbi:MAG: tetratricopeptide repeat protein, partial [Verrucomicrobiae bacterium]|nr:tetratricopeptide repeat protein [Verrucomicrobiae bacterium]
TLPLVLALCEWWRGRADPAAEAKPMRPPGPSRKERARTDARLASPPTAGQGSVFARLRAAWGTLRPPLLRLAPFFALALVFGLVTVWFQTHRAMAGMIYERDDFLTRVLGGGWALWFYLGKSLLPVQLSMIYPRWEVDPGWWPAWLPGLLWLGLLWVCWRFRHGWMGALGVALGSFTALLLPVLGFFEMSFFIHSRVGDHLQYLALLPVVALVTGVVGGWTLRRWGVSGASALAAGVVALLAWQTWERARVFQGPESLWRDTVAKNPKAWAAWNNLGMATRNQREEYECYTTALELNPNYADAHNNLGVLLYQRRRFHDAEMHFREALRLQPMLPPAHNNLGSVLSEAGRLNEALVHLRRAVELNPHYVDAWVNLGLAQLRNNEPAAAIASLDRALQLMPGHALGHLHRGNAAYQLGRYDEALAHYDAVLRLNPNHIEARHNLALALAALGRTQDAVAQFSAVLTLQPDFTPAQYQLAEIALRAGRPDEAAQRMETALQRQPDVSELHELLGRARLAQGQSAAALRHLREAVRLKPDWPQALASLARALATESDPALRDATEALRLAARARDLSSGTNWLALDALAAAQAAAGRLAEAARTAEEALALARNTGASNALAELEARAARYRSGRADAPERDGAGAP